MGRWPCRESTSAGPTSSQHIPWKSTSKRTVGSGKSCTRILEFGRIKLHICLTQNGVPVRPPLQRIRRIDRFFIFCFRNLSLHACDRGFIVPFVCTVYRPSVVFSPT